MKRNLWFIILAVLPIGLTMAPRDPSFARSPKFVPPDITGAGDIPYPLDSLASGIVTLSVNLDGAGQVQTVTVLRDIPSLTDPTITAVKSWTFSPGTVAGSPAPSTFNISVVFNPGSPQAQGLNLPPVQPTTAPNPAGYLPPEISSASFAAYPINSVAVGAVVLDVSVGKSDEIKNVVPIRSVPSLTSQSLSALNNWTINSATFNGKAINSNVAIAFVFRSPSSAAP